MKRATISNTDGQITSGQNLSYWTDSVKPLAFEKLDKDLMTDILVIGGGIAGLTTAYCLLKAGRQVTLVEDGLLGSGETGRTTAHLTAALDDRYYILEKTFGEEKAKLAAESHTAAVDFIELVVKNESIDCDFERVDGYLFVDPTDTKENIHKEFEASRRAGLKTDWLDQVPFLAAENGPCVVFPSQGQFHIMKYLHGLANAITKMGGTIYTNTHAEDIHEDGAKCNGHMVKAEAIVVATNTPINNRVAIHAKQFPYRTYVIAMLIEKDSIPHALWWDSGDHDSKWVTYPYHYVRLQKYDDTHDLLIAGGEDHKTGQADAENIAENERYAALVEWTRKRFPKAGEIIYAWSGQVMEPVDHLAYIGKNPGNKNIYIITGDSGNGMTHGTLGGMIVTDLIAEKENPWADLYSPKRSPLKVPKTYFAEIFNMVKQYGDYLSKSEIQDVDDLKTESGAILYKGFRRIAIYKKDNGEVLAFSAVCPHLGCIVHWNPEEKTFDCPCHGSRFTSEGIVINGPATDNLHKLDLED